MSNIIIMIQARMGSTRLPGKVLKEIDGKPLLWYLFQRLNKLKHKAKLVLATTISKKDDPLEDFSKNHGISLYRGSEEDVLDRFYQAAKLYKAEVIVRITGDCPLMDATIIDQGLTFFESGQYDYVSNVHPPTFPDGYDVEIFTFESFEKSWKEANKKSEREHVTPYYYNHTELFKLGNFTNPINLSDFRLTVDEQADFDLIKAIITQFKGKWIDLDMKQVIDFLNTHNEMKEMNKDFQRNEGYEKSLREDKK